MADKVFPARNLGGTADNWGREVEGELISLRKSLNTVTGQASNDGRSTSGQLAVTAQQLDNLERTVEVVQATVEILDTTVSRLDTTVDRLDSTVTELQNRKTLFATPANVSVTGNATTAPFPSATRVWTMAAPGGGRRSAVLSVSGIWGGSTASVAGAFFELLYAGEVVARSNASVPYMASAPAGWVDTVNLSTVLSIPSGTAPSFTIRITRVGFNTTSTALTLSNIKASLQYGDVV